MKKIICAAGMLLWAMGALAQGGTKSPYSQYGLGALSDQSTGFNKGMNGLGLAAREHNQVNPLNPASYSAVDSLSFIFDAGVSLQLTNFNEAGKKLNAKTANFDYVVAEFRAFKHVGMSFGLLPLSNVGYSYSTTQNVGDAKATTYTNSYSGSGGLRKVYLGVGWEMFKGFSLGFNAAYLWGDYSKTIANSYSDAYVKTLTKSYTADVSNYQLDFGLQTTFNLSKVNKLTLGLTYGLGHNLKSDPVCMITSTNSQTAVSDTAKFVAANGLQLPHTFGAGLMFNHANQLKIGVDYSLQKWQKVGFPEYVVVNEQAQYIPIDNYFKDRHKFTLGGEYCKNELSRNFFGRIRYKAGVSYTTPYLKINGQDGPKELSVSAGVSIPIVNLYNSRSLLNISAQWVRAEATNMIKENTFRINIGLTFNERWFMKWKVN